MYDFSYKMKKAGAEWQKEWDSLKALPQDNPHRVDFVGRVVFIARMKLDFDDCSFSVYKTVFKRSTSGTQDAWISWKQLCDAEGEDGAMVIATTKSLEQRVSKKYNPGHGLAWPKY